MQNRKRTYVCKRTLKIGLSYSIIARNKRLVGRWNMLEKIIELTNEYIESMPKKSVKNMDSFYKYGDCPFYG